MTHNNLDYLLEYQI